jgi:hypothetical protein
VVNKCLAIFRLHAESKTIAESERFEHEDRMLRTEYMPYLPRSERRIVRSDLRRARARSNRNAAWAALKQQDLTQARRLALSTVSNALTSLDSWRVMFCALRGH